MEKIESQPPLIEDLKDSLESYEKNGLLFVHFKHAKGLPKIEKSRNSVDPFAKIVFFNGK